MAAATETRVRFLGQGAVTVRRKTRDDPSYLRFHGELILSRGSRGAGPRAELLDETDQLILRFEYPVKVFHASFFMCVKDCSKLIHDMLARLLLTSNSEHHLAADEWMDSLRTPALHLAVAISHSVAHTATLVPWYDDIDVDVTIPELRVCLVCRELKAPLLSCKEEDAETGARGRNHCGEPCAICLSNLETTEGELSDLKKNEDEGTVRLPCSHAFHRRCILPWFHRALTCPTCRLGVMECFPREDEEF